MITAEQLNTLITFTATALTCAAQNAGYKGPEFRWATFIGITNGGQFCYEAHYHNGGEQLAHTKVFLTYDHAGNKVTADYVDNFQLS